jgi:hypothetical protein
MIRELDSMRNSGRSMGPGIAAVAATLALFTLPAQAETKVFGCSLVERYSQTQVHLALAHARTFADAGEVNSLYGQYVSLRNECRSNPGAKRVVHVSSRMAQLMSDD